MNFSQETVNKICELKHARVDEKLDEIHSDVLEIKSTLKDLTTFKIKAVTTITLLVFIINLFGLFLFEKIF
jgi:hypothetical protein